MPVRAVKTATGATPELGRGDTGLALATYGECPTRIDSDHRLTFFASELFGGDVSIGIHSITILYSFPLLEGL